MDHRRSNPEITALAGHANHRSCAGNREAKFLSDGSA
jgi:hypothetical protein